MPLQLKPHPLISVVMPVYNAEKYLAEAIESILQQTFVHFELIIVDDASQDGSWALIQQYVQQDPRVIPLQHTQNAMISRTLNTGIGQARGKYILRMDADDVAVLDRLQKQYDYMEAYPEVGVSGGVMLIMDESGKVFSQRVYHLDDATIRRHLFQYSPFSHPTIILRKSILDRCGLYNPEFDLAEDYELYFRIGRIARFGNLPEILLHYRMVEKSITGRGPRAMEFKTLAIRCKARREYGYRMTRLDQLIWVAQWLAIFLIPVKLKKRLFLLLRSGK